MRHALAILFVVAPAAAVAAPSAEELVEKSSANYRGFGGQRVEVRMTVKDTKGAEQVYELVELDLETPEGRRVLLRVKSPKSHAGTALLVREVPNAEDEVYLYLAATDELTRVSDSERSTRLLGSELELEQLTFPKKEDYLHRTTGEATVDGRACWQVEHTPKVRTSNYGKIIACIDKETFATLELTYFDRAGAAAKVLRAQGYRKHGGQWRPDKMVVENLRNGRSTVFEATSYKIGVTLSERLFTPSQLRKR